MSAEQVCVPGVSSRRFACDRCRGQKLRCLREHNDQQSCDRCLRADAECRTSPIFRIRNYEGADVVASNNNSRGERAPRRPRLHYHDPPQTQILPQSTRDPAETIHPLTVLGDITPADIFNPSHQSFNTPEQSGDFPVTNTTGDMQWEAENPMLYDLLFSAGMDKPFELFGSTGNSPRNSRSEAEASSMQQAATQSPFSPASFLQIPPSASPSAPQTVDSHGRASLAAELDSNLTHKSRSGQVAADNIVESDAEEIHLQRLSNVNLTLVTLLARIDKGSPTVTIETLVEPIDESISQRTTLDDILNGTREFLEVLGLLAGISQSPSANHLPSNDPSPISRPKSNLSRPSIRRQSSGCSSSLSERNGSISSSPTNSIDSSTSTPQSTSKERPSQKLHFASLLLILTSYINLLRLYVVLFTHIHAFLKELAESDNPYLCPLPGLSFSSFPLQSGNLQTIILIKIITSLFERMERLLGLPQEFRINTRGSGSDGLLRDDEFVDVVKLVFRKQESDQSETKKGGVKELRKHLKKIKQLLRDSIAL